MRKCNHNAKRRESKRRENRARLERDEFKLNRHARACRGHPRLKYHKTKTWMAGTSPAMTSLLGQPQLTPLWLAGVAQRRVQQQAGEQDQAGVAIGFEHGQALVGIGNVEAHDLPGEVGGKRG